MLESNCYRTAPTFLLHASEIKLILNSDVIVFEFDITFTHWCVTGYYHPDMLKGGVLSGMAMTYINGVYWFGAEKWLIKI